MKILLLFVMVFVLSCNNNGLKADFSINEAFPTSRLSSYFFYDIINLDSPYYKIKWGHKGLDTLITDTTFSLLGNGVVSYLTANKNAILFEQGCGTNCNYVLILPFNKLIKPKVFYECIAVDTLNNLAAYITEDDTSFFAIENFLTDSRIKFNENNICNSPSKFSCIDSCYFESTSFYLKWFGKNYQGSKNPDWVVKKYSTRGVLK